MASANASEAWQAGPHAVPAEDLLAGGGVMGAAIRRFDWAATSLGPIDAWPVALTASLRLVIASRQPMCMWWGPDLLSFHNDAYVPMLGERRDIALGRPMAEVWGDVWEGVLPMLRSAIAGEATWFEDMPLTMERNGYPEETFWTFSYSPLYGDDGRVAGVLNIVNETTRAVFDRRALTESYERAKDHLREKDAYEGELRLLNRELGHRMKNTLAMTQAIVSQSLRGAATPMEAMVAVNARIGALARAQDILTGTGWTAGSLGDVVTAALEPHDDGGERFDVAGPPLSISARQGVGLALALHELATNATKYGALSVASGRIEVRWSLDADGRFVFRWTESGGPLVRPPTSRGFGSRLTERVVSQMFQGEGVMSFEPSGLRFVLSGSLDAEGFEEDSVAPAAIGASGS